MPIAPRRGADRTAITVGLISVAGVVMTLFLASRILGLAREGDLQVSADKQVFVLGEAEQWSADVAQRGPVFFPDASNRDRDIYVQHLGDDPESGWLAFGVRPLGAAKACVAAWDPPSRTFVDSCNGDEYPQDGSGLPQYPATVSEDGRLSVDLNAAFRESPDPATERPEE